MNSGRVFRDAVFHFWGGGSGGWRLVVKVINTWHNLITFWSGCIGSLEHPHF
jgi:hypothetical protein